MNDTSSASVVAVAYEHFLEHQVWYLTRLLWVTLAFLVCACCCCWSFFVSAWWTTGRSRGGGYTPAHLRRLADERPLLPVTTRGGHGRR